MKILWELFNAFFKTGLFTFGGGYAMLPLLKDEVVIKRHWLTEEELVDYFSIGQCTPGIIAVNVSTFCGYKLKGISGAVMATFAIILPSLIIISLIASVLRHYIENPVVASAFAGIRIGVCALLANLILDMSKKIFSASLHRKLYIFIFTTALVLLLLGNVSAAAVVVFSTLAGFFSNLKISHNIPKWIKGDKK